MTREQILDTYVKSKADKEVFPELYIRAFINGVTWADRHMDLASVENGDLIKECIKRKIYIESKK